MEKKTSLIHKVITHPEKVLTYLGRRGYFNWMSDEAYIKLLYYLVFKKFPDLENPQSFNEKIQWLKLHDRNPLYTKLVDKYEVKKYVVEQLGSEEYIIPTYGVWEHFDDIDFTALPNKFVLKCTHDSGSVVICRDKNQFDIKQARKRINRGLSQNFFYFGREWPYKDVKPRIIAEKLMEDEGELPNDYKVFCFNGNPQLIEVDYDRFVEHKRNLYSVDWEYINAEICFASDVDHEIAKPESLQEMLDIAKKLSKGIPLLRADFYCINEKIYFGELTFHHGTGLEEFRPEEFCVEVGNLIMLPGGVLIRGEYWRLYIRWDKNKKRDTSPVDYNFFCFNGITKYCQVISDRFIDEKNTFYNMEWKEQLFIGLLHPREFQSYLSADVSKKTQFNKMRELACHFTEGIPFIRVDFYECNSRHHFEKPTFYSFGGFGKFSLFGIEYDSGKTDLYINNCVEASYEKSIIYNRYDSAI